MSKLKTAWDAVNELRGNLNNTPNFSGGEMYLFHFVNHDRIGSSYGKHGLDGVINHICTVDEFNALVEDMTLGLDVNPVNHGHYLNYVDADKALLKNENNPLVYTQEMADDGELPSVGMECMAYIYAGTSKQGNPMNSWVDGEFIGKCKSSNGGFCFVFKAKDDIHHVINANSHFKPIDTRTKKEKAIDEIFNNMVWDNSIELLGLAYDEWVGE
tara:strand:- start:1915 stop:2556 length:642 start_codon:yes stop_codon:yes gene_type:complete